MKTFPEQTRHSRSQGELHRPVNVRTETCVGSTGPTASGGAAEDVGVVIEWDYGMLFLQVLVRKQSF